MEKVGIVKYVSTGWCGYADLYAKDDNLFVKSTLTGNMIKVGWLEESKSVEPIR